MAGGSQTVSEGMTEGKGNRAAYLRKSRFGITCPLGHGTVPTICCLGRQGNKEEEEEKEVGRDGVRKTNDW